MKLGVISYRTAHLKTEQVVSRLIRNPAVSEICIFALPFKERKTRDVLLQHRPLHSFGVNTRELCRLEKVRWVEWSGECRVDEIFDYFLIAGAGILDVNLLPAPIINVHPGIIPMQRGLDALKWAILNGSPIGNTLHFIDNEVDCGEVLHVDLTEIFESDTIESVFRRHYENEINLLANFMQFLPSQVPITNYPTGEPTKRMPYEIEQQLKENFDSWRETVVKEMHDA